MEPGEGHYPIRWNCQIYCSENFVNRQPSKRQYEIISGLNTKAHNDLSLWAAEAGYMENHIR